MAVAKATEVCISFIRECSVKIEDYSNLVLEQDNWLEELYLDSRNKLSASVEGNIILPKTPAAKRGRKPGRKNKQDVAAKLLEVAEDNKENVAGEQRHSEAQETKVEERDDEQSTTPVLSRSGRAAAKAANTKIKESQRLLNDLSSKRRRPDASDEYQFGTSVMEMAQSCKRKNKRDHSDSGVYDRYSTCSNASTASTRSTRNQRGANTKHSNMTAHQQQVAAVAADVIVIEESDEEEDDRTDDDEQKKVIIPVVGRKVEFCDAEVVVASEGANEEAEKIVGEDVTKSLDKIRKRSSLSHLDEPSKKMAKTDLPPNALTHNNNNNNDNHLAQSKLVCRVELASLDVASVDKEEQSSERSHATDKKRSVSLQRRRTLSSTSSLPRSRRSLSSTRIDKSSNNTDNLMQSCKSPQHKDCKQKVDIIEPPHEFSEKVEEPAGEEQPEFKQPEIPLKTKPIEMRSPPKPLPRTTRTKTRNLEKETQQQHEEVVKQQSVTTTEQAERPSRVTRTKKRQAEETECPRPIRDSSVSSLHSESSNASSTRTTRTKKRKLEQQEQIHEPQGVEEPPASDLAFPQVTEVCLVTTDSENDEDGNNTNTGLKIGSGHSTASSLSKPVTDSAITNAKMVLSDQVIRKSPLPVKNVFGSAKGTNNNKKFVSTLRMVEEAIRNSCPDAVSVCVSPLRETIIKSAASPKGVSRKDAPFLDCVDEINHKSYSDRDDTNKTEDESFDETDEEEEEQEEEEEPELLLEPPRRMTRSKVRLQQQVPPTAAAAGSPAERYKIAAAAVKGKKQMVSTGKFSPKPFSNRIGVKQLAAAYTDHVVSASTPLAKGQLSRGLSRVSSTSRLPPNTSSRLIHTPQTLNRIRGLHPTAGLSSSSDSHHYRHISKVVTPSTSNRPKNLVVSGIKSFLSSSVAVQPARPTREELQELREEDIRRKREKEEETLRKREERLRAKGVEAKKRNDERMRKVQEARLANERKAAELKESQEKEKRQQQQREKRLREEKIREEALKKKMALLKKAEEEKRKKEEDNKRKEEEAQRKKEEAEEKRKEEAERRAAQLKQQEEQKLEEEKLAEDARRAEEKRKILEEKQRREVERQAREKEELHLLKEREAARLAATAHQQQQQKLQAIPLNQTFDANSTYTVGGAANTTYNAAPKTPAASSRPDSYEMTPAPESNNYDIADLKSEDSSDDDSNPKKKVPKWATRSELHRAQINQEYSTISVDKVFPCQELLLLPDLDMIFKTNRSRFKIRSSSAHWTTPPHKIFSTKTRLDA